MQKLLLALCLSASYANAAVITQTMSIPEHTPGSGTGIAHDLVFNQFNTALGTLTSVQIIFNLSMVGGALAVDNDSDSAQSITASLSLQTKLTSGDVSLANTSGMTGWTEINNVVSQHFDLSATTGDDIKLFTETGLGDWGSFVGPTVAKTENRNNYMSSAFLGGYMGTGTYTITATTLQTSGPGNAGVNYSVTQQQAYGDVTIKYTYTPVPEPATASLAGVGLLMLLRRRRKA